VPHRLFLKESRSPHWFVRNAEREMLMLKTQHDLDRRIHAPGAQE
jgi:hypothetical protein